MSRPPRAVETKWHGCRFRSKLEARWAVVFEAMGLEWRYEPGGFVLGRVWYEPDFIVSGLDGRGSGWTFVEVKGSMDERSRRKVELLAGSWPVYVVGNMPYGKDALQMQFDAWCDDDAFHSFTYIDGDSFGAALGVNEDGLPELFGADSSYTASCDMETTRLCFDAASYARFDHGETPEGQEEFISARRRIGILRAQSRRKDKAMPKLDTLWKDIEESAGGGFSDIEPGAYVLTITGCNADRFEEALKRAGGRLSDVSDGDKYFEITWDVAEGPRKGAYAKSQYPPSARIYFTKRSEGFLKHRLHMLADWNEGFQPTVAFDNDQWQQFVGKRFGAIVRRRLYTAGPNSKTPGADRHSMDIAAWTSPEEHRSGKVNPDLLKDLDQRTAEPQAAPVQAPVQAVDPLDLYAEDVPF